MKHLYAPWRGMYLDPNKQKTLEQTCVFCIQKLSQKQLSEHYLLKKFNHNYVMLNAYPYNPGQLLVIPFDHVDSLEKLSQAARTEMMEIIAKSIEVLPHVLKNDGTNVGFNLGGKAAGGTIPEHLHGHIVPRWFGDTNFMPILAETKQLSADLNCIYKELLPHFSNMVL